MRNNGNADGLSVKLVSGTHVVLMGFDLTDAARAGCLGFAIHRRDRTENNEERWLQGMKTFAATDPGIGLGGQVSSEQHPFQTFQWADYAAKPNHDYTYKIVPVYGTPQQRQQGTSVSLDITTETEFGNSHSIFFNRGAIASQEYARRFKNQSPSKLTGAKKDEAYAWLSRGLLEALLAFIRQATDASYGLYGAIYEFQWAAVLEALRDVAAAGAKVQVIYDEIPVKSGRPATPNKEAITNAGIEALCTGRTVGKIMHNKFFVLTKDDQPVAVWTGSTNLTENGIFGHSNLGHVVEDENVAAAYLRYWEQLKIDAAKADDILWTTENNPNPPDPWDDDLRVVFSPQTGQKVLLWYAQLAHLEQKPLFMTFAFGMNKEFQKVYELRDGVLRFALMEKEGNGKGLKKGKEDIRRIRRLPNVVVAVGNSIQENSFDRWLKERQKLTAEANVRYVHTKYMLFDPLGENPVVVTGSANFSNASTDTNHENMLVIRGNKRVADIYVGEFMRLYSHYAYRESLLFRQPGDDQQPKHLLPDDSWQKDYYKPGNQRFLRRQYFAGT